MVFNGVSILWIVVAGIMVWVAVVSFMVMRMIRHYNHLTGATSKTGLREVLETMLAHDKDLGRRIELLEKAAGHLHTAGISHIQKIGVVRFNPFADTGGAQSFTLAILDGDDSGVIMTSLYGRMANRWYVKQVTQGRAKGVELSKEEEAAIAKAKKG